MKIEVKRIKRGKNSTLSELYIDGDFYCYGLENKVRVVKIKGRTAVPKGNYRLQLNTYGSMNVKYRKKFPDWHRGMLEIIDIPNYNYVYIHIGNYHSDTKGCLLVGEYYKSYDDDFAVFDSTKAYQRLYRLLLAAMSTETVYIHMSTSPAP